MQEDETRQQLSDEVAALRQRVAELEGAESERQPAEEALRQSRDRERFLADVIENADQPVSVGYPDGRLGICNRAFCALTGYSAAELQSLDWSTVLTPPEWLESEMKALAELERTGRPVRYQKEYIRKDGRRVPIELLVHAVRDESGPVHLYYAFVTDITERVRAEQALKGYSQRLEEMVEERTQKLREREQWLSTTLRSIGDAVITTDAQGEVTLMNPVAEDLTGWDTAEAVGKPLEDVLNIINEQTGEPVESPVARVLREGVVVGLANHTLLIARDGTRRPIADSGAPMQDEAGHIVGTVMVFRDITARRRAEEALERRVAELSALSTIASIVDESLDVDEILNRAMDEALRLVGVEAAAMMLLDDPSTALRQAQGDSSGQGEAGELVMAAHRGISADFVRAFGRMKLGEGLSGQVAQTGAPAVLRDLTEYPEARRSYLKEAEIRSAAVVPLLGRTGVIGTMNLGATSPEYFDAAGLELLVGLGRQIAVGVEKARLFAQARARTAELEAAHQQLREAQERLIRQEKLAVLGQLAGGVGHELRNPLGAIKNAAYFLHMVLEDPDAETQEVLEVLDQEVATSEKIIASLLDYARPQLPLRRQVALNAVVQETLARTPLPDAPRSAVVLQLDEDLPLILADPDQLVQVLGNLVRNGLQAMPGGGRLTIRTARESEWVAVSVADTGVGIPPENLSKLFEPLFTTKAKGIGLGLAVTKTLVEGHGGSIAVQSAGIPGQGSIFTVRLPLDPEAGAASPAPAAKNRGQ